jgi:hypothetical protein
MKILAAILGLAFGATLAAALPSSAAAKPKDLPSSFCGAIGYCLFESENYCGMSYADIQTAQSYYADNCT